MPFTLVDIRKRVKALAQDDGAFITAAELEEVITGAIEQVNQDSPDRKVEDLAGDGTKDLAMPSTWERGFSIIESVELLTGSPAVSQTPRNFLDRDDDYYDYEDPSKSPTQRLRFNETTPSSTEKIRLVFTATHAVTLTTTTLSNTTFKGVIYKSLVFVFRALAANFSQATDPTIDADSVLKDPNAFLFTAERWQTNYKDVIGLNKQQIKADSSLGDYDIKTIDEEDYLFHLTKKR